QHLGQGGAEQDGAEEVNIEVDLAPEEPPSAETAPLSPDSLHELVELARRSGHDEAAVCASSVLVALGMATADEGDLHSAALARGLGIAEPPLYVAKLEPAVVLPTATEPPGMLVGLEVPKRYHSRQQRFLSGRALAHIRRGTHALAGLAPEHLAQIVADLVRLAAPDGTDLSRLAPSDPALAQVLAQALPPDERSRLAALAERAAAEPPPRWESLAPAPRQAAAAGPQARRRPPAAA